jgi:hypothetical protein
MPTFTDKQEAIDYYKAEEPSLKGMPDYIVGCLIDFSRKYDDYDEYLTVEQKVQNGGLKSLTKKEAKKYGHLSFEKVHVTHPKNAIIHDHIKTEEAGEFDDLGTKEGFEKYNKYGLTYNEKQEPLKSVKFQFKDEITGEKVIVEKDIEEIRKNPDKAFETDSWDVKHEPADKKLKE